MTTWLGHRSHFESALFCSSDGAERCMSNLFKSPQVDTMSLEIPTRPRRSEIIVLAIVGVLFAALAIPAIFAAREAARRNQCANNLRIISLGVLNYADAFVNFPFGTVGSRELPPVRRFSSYPSLWVFFEGKPPTLLVDTNQAWDAEVNRSPRLRYVMDWAEPTEHSEDRPLHYLRLFSCPSASRELRVQGIQVTQYVGMAGLGKNAPEFASGDPGVGIWGYDRQVRPRDIVDGTANTILLVETAHDLGPWIAGGPPTVRGLDVTAVPLIGSRGQLGGLHRTIPASMADASSRQIDPGIDVTVLSALTTTAGGD
jgi:Protein of unknown function (DUF1559)